MIHRRAGWEAGIEPGASCGSGGVSPARKDRQINRVRIPAGLHRQAGIPRPPSRSRPIQRGSPPPSRRRVLSKSAGSFIMSAAAMVSGSVVASTTSYRKSRSPLRPHTRKSRGVAKGSRCKRSRCRSDTNCETTPGSAVMAVGDLPRCGRARTHPTRTRSHST